jgi:hypothetical protein
MTALASPPALRPLPIGLLYYPGVRCPACGGRHFHIGRATAECDRCAGALVITDTRPFSSSEELLNGR